MFGCIKIYLTPRGDAATTTKTFQRDKYNITVIYIYILLGFVLYFGLVNLKSKSTTKKIVLLLQYYCQGRVIHFYFLFFWFRAKRRSHYFYNNVILYSRAVFNTLLCIRLPVTGHKGRAQVVHRTTQNYIIFSRYVSGVQIGEFFF